MRVNAIAMPFSFAAAIDSSSLIDPPRLETGVRLAAGLLSFGRAWVRVRSLNRKIASLTSASVFEVGNERGDVPI
jgi:hypothetical protein